MRTNARWLVAIIAIATLATACSSGTTSETSDAPGDTTPQGAAADQRNTDAVDRDADLEPVDGGELIFAVEAESDGYNPVNHRWSYSGNLIGSSVYEPLMSVTPERGVEPWLAESVEPNEDGTVWTVTPRDGITFHDGTPFDAEIVAANLQARVDGILTSRAVEPIETVEATAAGTVIVTMKRPWAQWDKTLASQSGFMMSQANIDDPAAEPTGTGPFQWASWSVGDQIVVDRYDAYWGDTAHLDRITFKVVVEPSAREQALEAGDVDAIMTQEATSIAEYRDTDFTVVEDGLGDTAVVMLNGGVAPFDNPIAREAITAATDNETFADIRYGGLVEVAESPFAREEIWYTDDNGYVGYDPERAATLVAEYEQQTGGPLQVSLIGPQGTESQGNMEVLAAQWAEVGIETQILPTEQAALISETVSGTYQAAMFRNFSWADPDFNYIFWTSANALGQGNISVNFTQTANEQLDEAITAGREAFDDELDVRKQAYADVARILNEEHAYVWLYHSLGAIVAKPEVRGWTSAAERGFYRQDAKTWWQDLWIQT